MQMPPQGASAAPPSWRAQPTTANRWESMGNLEKTSQVYGNPSKIYGNLWESMGIYGNPGKNLTNLWESLEILWESMGILGKTSQTEPHPWIPGNPGKKPHNLSPIPWTSGNPGKNLTILRICLLLLVGSDKLCRGPLRGQTLRELSLKALDEIYKIYRLLHRSDLNISAKKSSEMFQTEFTNY